MGSVCVFLCVYVLRQGLLVEGSANYGHGRHVHSQSNRCSVSSPGV